MPASPPESGRQIVIAGQAVAYRLRRSARRTIGLTIDHAGLRVGAPQRARIADIEALLREHGDWVLAKLDAWKKRPAPEMIAVADGLAISAFGRPLTVRIAAASRAGGRIAGDTLHLAVPPAVDAASVLEKTLREHARRVFAERLALHAPRLGVPVPPLRLSSARTRWGSCSSRGGIALNWRLVFLPLPVVDYVVCHELAHLKEMNHSPRFWSVVEQLCPDWQALRVELRRRGRDLPRF
ncbi:MAG: SprT family zinc-dependent metalloprotease [Dechloromonas sp.]|nr:SprT family zinc-dependent metalloprotease [Dechloromonas sp.]